MNSDTTIAQVQSAYPNNMVIGVKNPYLKVSFNGKISLRNDNPENIIFEGEVPANQLIIKARINLELKNRGNEYFKQN